MNIEAMPETQGERIRKARERRGLTQQEVADKAGTVQQTVDKLERNITSHSRYLNKILFIVGLLPDDQKPDALPIADVAGETRLFGNKDLPVYGAAAGSGGGALILTSEPVDYVRRPAPLENVKDAYGMIVVQDSMAPEFRAGDTALVHPHAPPLPGDACIFYSDDGHGSVKATIKSFVRQTETHWYVEQWNPPKRFSLPKEEWTRCHRVVGRYARR